MRKFVLALVAGALALGAMSAAGAAPGGPGVRMRVSATSGLVDGQTVRVRASGITPGQDVRFLECPDRCTYWTPPFATADARGEVDVLVPLQRFIAPNREDWPSTDPAVDCAYQACTLAVVIPDYTTEWPDGYWKDISYSSLASVPISFARVPTTKPAVTVEPAGLLPPSTTDLTLHVSGLTPGVEAYAIRCVGGATLPPGNGCDWNYQARSVVDAAGRVDLTVPVSRRWFDTDCLASGVLCTVRLTADDRSQSTVPLSFDPSVSLPPLPTLSASHRPLTTTSGTVHVHGEHWPPGVLVHVSQCWPGRSCRAAAGPTADADGVIDADASVVRFTAFQPFDPIVDCAAVNCDLRANAAVPDAPEGYPTAHATFRFGVDRDLPVLSLHGAKVTEGGPGTHTVDLVASLQRPADHDVWFGRYGGGITLLKIPAGATSIRYSFAWTGDSVANGDRVETVTIIHIDGAQPDRHHAVARVLIRDDDPPAG